MGDVFLHNFSRPTCPAPAPTRQPPVGLAGGEDPIECDAVRRHGCAFWRSDWQACDGNSETRITARELGYGGPGYCLFEMRCIRTRSRTARQGWYLNWRNFTPVHGMRLIADYRSKQEPCP